MRRTRTRLLCILLCLAVLFPSTASAELTEQSSDVAINETNFPDANFRQYISETFDKDSSSGLSSDEIAAVTSIDCSSKGISSLKGIEYFTELTTLNCSNNNLKTLDVSNNTKLTYLNCNSNQLTELDVKVNTALGNLYCDDNQLTELDVSNHTALKSLGCVGNNQLTKLDVSNNTALESLNCSGNLTTLDVSKSISLKSLSCIGSNLTSLDVSNNTALEILYCGVNELTSLDVSNNTALKYFGCGENNLTSLNVSKNIALESLGCGNNSLTSLDVSNNTALTSLSCERNNLTSLDVSNNTMLKSLACHYNSLTSLDVSSNPNLETLTYYYNQYTIAMAPDARTFDLSTLPVGFDVSRASSWTGGTVSGNTLTVDDGATQVTYFYDCGGSKTAGFTLVVDLTADGIAIDETNFADEAFRNYVSETFDTTKDGILSSDEIEVVTNIDCSSNDNISSLKGIEYFTELIRLDCYDTKLTTMDVSKNTKLTYLDCSRTNLTTLDVKVNTALEYLYCSSNQLTSLDVSNNPALKGLRCFSNQLTSLDVSNNPLLTELFCFENKLPSLDVNKNIALTYLNCYSNQLTSLDVSQNTALNVLVCNNNNLTALDVSSNLQLTTFDCESNRLTALDVSKNGALNHLYCSSNQLASLDVSKNGALEYLYCYSNQLTSLDVSQNNLTTLECNYNRYTITVNPAVRTFDLSTLPGGFDVSRASGWTGGTASGNTLTIDDGASQVTYTYDCGRDKTAEFTLLVNFGSHTHVYGDWSKDADSHWKECGDAACPDKTGSVKDKAAHEFEWKVDQAATAEAPGLKHEECKICGYRRNENTPINPDSHTHVYGDWSKDADNHWKECGDAACPDKTGSVKDKAAHEFEWKVDQAATTEASGLKHEECKICGYRRSENTVIDKLPSTNPPSGGGGSSSSGGSSAPSVTVPVSGESNTVDVSVSVSGSTATVIQIDTAQINSVVKDGGKADAVEIDFTGLGKSIETVKLPTAAIKDIAEAAQKGEAGGLTVKLSDGEVSFDADALSAIQSQAGSQITLTLTPAKPADLSPRQKEAVGNAPVYDLTLKSDSGAITDFKGGYATVSLPYTLKAGEDPSGIVVYYLDNNGNITPCKTMYDVRSKSVIFTTGHFSVYFVGYDPTAVWENPFSDMSGDAYYAEAVKWAVLNGVTSGTSANTFSPDASCTRAQMAVFLWNAAGKPEPRTKTTPFSDVKGDEWYGKAVFWAADNGIASGLDGGRFAPNDPCTRAQMTAFLSRYAKAEKTNASNPFVDVKKEAWYYDDVIWAVKEEITAGTSATTFEPESVCTRAQMVTFLYRLLGK